MGFAHIDVPDTLATLMIRSGAAYIESGDILLTPAFQKFLNEWCDEKIMEQRKEKPIETRL